MMEIRSNISKWDANALKYTNAECSSNLSMNLVTSERANPIDNTKTCERRTDWKDFMLLLINLCAAIPRFNVSLNVITIARWMISIIMIYIVTLTYNVKGIFCSLVFSSSMIISIYEILNICYDPMLIEYRFLIYISLEILSSLIILNLSYNYDPIKVWSLSCPWLKFFKLI